MAATFFGSITGTTLSIGFLQSGIIVVGDALYGTGVLQGTFIVSGSGSTWTVNYPQTVIFDGSSILTTTGFNNNIVAGRPPLLWSDVQEAFVKVNENFDILVATIGGGSGLTPIDFDTLDTSVSPATDNLDSLGNTARRWQAVFTSEHTSIDPLNGLWAGNAQIKGIGITVNLPDNSTIGGDPLTGIGTSLIIDPEKTFFKSVQVDNSDRVVAGEFAATLNLNSGTAVQLVLDSAAESITVNNTGVTSMIAGPAVSISSATGNITVSNTGVRQLTNTGGLGTRTAGLGIHVSSATGTPLITNTGVLQVQQGFGITVSTDADTGIVSVSNSAPAQVTFRTIAVQGSPSLVADSTSDTLTVEAGYGMIITTDEIGDNDKLIIAFDQRTDIIGSVFADDSSPMVDAVDNRLFASNGIFGNVTGNVAGNVTGNVAGNVTGNVVGNITGNVLGNVTGDVTGDTVGYHTGDVTGSVFSDGSTLLVDSTGGRLVGDVETARLRTSETSIALGQNAGLSSQSGSAVAIGSVAGLTNQGASAIGIGFGAGGLNQGISAVAIGAYAGSINQGAYSISIGDNAGLSNQPANSIVINASGSPVSNAAAGFYVRPIREVTGPQTVYYDPVTYEVTWGPVPAGGGGGGSVSVGEYVFKVAGDDSTQRVINNGETLQFIGAAGITTASDAEGTITISAAGVSGLASRTSAAASTGSIADAATATATITGFKGYVLYKIQTSAAAWVRIYTSVAARTADSARLENVDPLPGSGVIAEIISTAAETILITPGTIGFNDESSPNTDIELAVTNKSGGTADITVTLTIVQVEA